MGSPRRISDAARQAITADARATIGTPEGALRRIAARHGVSDATVRRCIAEAGDIPPAGSPATRDRMKNAIETRQLTMADRRARLAERLIDIAEQCANDIQAGSSIVFNFGGKDNSFEMRRVDFVPGAERRNLIITLGTALDKHKMLDNYDSDVRDRDALTAWLDHMTGRNLE